MKWAARDRSAGRVADGAGTRSARERLGVAAGVSAAVVAFALSAAHFLRSGEEGLVALFLAAPLLLLWRRRWVPVVLQAMLAVAFAEWLWTAVALTEVRQSLGLPWIRMASILGAVALFTAFAAVMLRRKPMTARFDAGKGNAASVGSFVLVGAILAPVQLIVDPPGLLLERFWPTGGWLEIGLLGVYAAWMTDHMLGRNQALWRRRLWSFFSAAFFAQLLLGLVGFERFLMTGNLHLPVPALIAAGPLFRGEGLFMPILFGATVLLVGPAWCSHLCYVGAWDNEAARARRRPADMPSWRRPLQVGMLVLVTGGALVLGAAGVPGSLALWPAAALGVVGVGVMVAWSRRTGVMTHCTAFCPIAVLSTWLGRVSPFRLRISDGCDRCGGCSAACRYDALGDDHLARRRPGESCTLCGDCLERCRSGRLSMWLPGLGPKASRTAFVVLVVALHAAFLGVARI